MSDDKPLVERDLTVDEINRLLRGEILRVGGLGLATGMVLVDRKLLEEALAQLEETVIRDDCEDGGNCYMCGIYPGYDGQAEKMLPIEHAPDCRYVRATDALRKAIGK